MKHRVNMIDTNNTASLSLVQVIIHLTAIALVSYTRVCVAVQLHTQEKDRDMALLLAGITTQLGAMLGAILFFVLVYFTDIFNSPM